MIRSRWWRLLVPVAVTAAGLAVSAWMVRDGPAPYSLLVLTVLISAWYGGYVMGLVATMASVLAVGLIPLDAELRSLDSAGAVIQLLVFAGVGVLTSTFVDLQRRQRSSLEELRAQSIRLAQVMRSIGIGHWYSDLPTQQMQWDDQCRAHLGLEAEADITLERFYSCIQPEDRARVQREAERAIFAHASCDVDFRVLHPEAAVRWVKVLGRGFYDASGRPTRFEGISVDISRQKEIEAALAEANRLKDEFLGTLSHELRTPLNAVLGWARLMSSGNLPPHRFAHALSVIERNAQLQARLVEDLLDLSSIITGRLRLRVEPCDFGAIVVSAVEAIRPAAEARGVAITASIEPEACWITADADRLRQVSWNLLANAVKYTPEGGQIRVELLPIEGQTCLRVQDNGVGIDPCFLPHVFDRFSQGRPADATGLRGLGLGLAIVRELVEAHGGTVQAHSEGAGHGATFTITLPGRMAAPAIDALATSRVLPR